MNFGIASLFRTQETAPNGKIKGWHTIYRIEIGGYFAHIFYRDIGFRLPRKQNGWRYVNDRCREESWNIYPTDASRLKDLKVRRDDLVNRWLSLVWDVDNDQTVLTSEERVYAKRYSEKMKLDDYGAVNKIYQTAKELGYTKEQFLENANNIKKVDDILWSSND